MNWRHVLLGGLAAGVIMTFSGAFFGHVVLGPEYIAAVKKYFPMESPAKAIAKNSGIRVGLGLLAVLLYTGLRSRFGVGPRTAVIAGSVIFLAGYVPLSLTLNELSVLTGWRFWVTQVWGLAEVCLATIVGSYICRVT